MRTGIELSFENPREARKPGRLPQGKRFEAERERLKSLERNERVFKGQPDTGEAISSYVYQSLRNKAVDYLRSRRTMFCLER